MMLNIDMKRKINTLRDILVGRIPDPKTQVDQITLAMIYKFMDDMDTEFVGDWGGKRRFFLRTDKTDYERYAWSNIMQPQVSGEERSALYREGIESMARNPHIPQLFRDIFNNAYIPFRDSETINMFLKEIDDFKYDNSEDLGNAFEMLLQIMGSQGDAGQFRTPRHIIDMIVEITEPSKTDTILDPACGTAGFLISAYKHILNNNRDDKGKSALTPDERKALNQNITGYDISPDMVRLSNVNMYLHHFPDPKIHNYDTLTSEARWDDNFDVILANPPFMTPKGGINPHKRFRVNARRSEVLFVDYIAEHLTPNGKAGIIVPEGIVFQTSNAYKELRKMLIADNYLYAVISLPAGVFNPYSGVKTSILLLNRTIAKQAENILFVKIDYDGYDLGAQRREIKENDIPRTIDTLRSYKKKLLSGNQIEAEEFNNDYTILASKKEILEKDCVLVGERYKKVEHNHNIKWDLVKIKDVCEIINGRAYKREELLDQGKYKVLRVGNFFSQNSWYYSDLELDKDKYCNKGDLLYAWSASFGPKIWDDGKTIFHYHIWKVKTSDMINKKFLYYVLLFQTESIKSANGRGIAMVHITKSAMENWIIPLPPLSVQQEIVEEIEGYQKIIDGARQIIENYKPVIKIDPEWEMFELGEVATFMTGGTPRSTVRENYENGEIPWLVSGDIHKELITDCDGRITMIGLESSNAKVLPENSVLIALNGQGKTRGTVALLKMSNATCNQSIVSINPIDNNLLLAEFLYYQMKAMYQQIRNITGDSQRSGLNIPLIKRIKVFIPDIEIQTKIVKALVEESNIVESNNILIEIFEQKIKEKIAEVWGE